MGSALCSINLLRGGFLGTRVPAHIRKMAMAGVEARRTSFRCTAIMRNGERCGGPVLRGEDACRHHLRDPVRRAHADAERRERAQRRVDLGYPRSRVERAVEALNALDKSQLHRSWKIDARIPGVTITFTSDDDRVACERWLVENCGVDINQPISETGRMASPRLCDRLYWSAWRVLRGGDFVTVDFIGRAKNRVRAALRDECFFWRKWEDAGGDQESI